MTVVVVGGAYRETCAEPSRRWTYGSGVRAAALLDAATQHLVTVADNSTLREIEAVLRDVQADATPRCHPIEFRYDTPLSPPRLIMDDSDRNVEVPVVDAEDAIVFGMVEAQPTVSARRAVVDPQHSLSLDQVFETITADELILVANLRDVLDLAGIDDLSKAIEEILGGTRAEAVVVKAGALGALVCARGAEPVGIPALATPRVFPIGSGDVFTAALAARYFESGDLVEAAHSASRRVAGYVMVRHLRAVDLGDDVPATVAPTVLSVQDPPRVYVAASFANPEQRWSGRTIDGGINDIGGHSISPLREVGEKEDAKTTAEADLACLDTCDALVLLADVARTGPFFEAGWATCRGTPVVVMNSDPDPDRYTMLNGTGADVVPDLASAAYRAVWAGLEHRERPRRTGQLMLLSGGLDSAAVAALQQPDQALFVDYGQVPAEAERKAARAVARHLDLELGELEVDLSTLGSGLLAGRPQLEEAPTPEWFPFRNQQLVTLAAAHALKHRLGSVVLGTVAGDGSRHADSTPGFVTELDTLLRSQEGGIRVLAPHINTPAHELLMNSGLPDAVINQTYSCHSNNLACSECPGCRRRIDVLSRLRELQAVLE